ncbi:MAG: AMP-binding protein, partial [Candidatus Riflebacteria bacterium]|nr:AMP-binding protein [Candidatus Riflebacteria bacterium]
LEGYGLTETSPVLAGNRPEAYRFGTVGKPIAGVELKLAEDGEILARGPNVMKGYLDDPQETARAIDAGGWFHTGDTGTFDPDGFLLITGRKKSVFKLATGKYVNPDPIETRMAGALVCQTLVCGENQIEAGMLVFPNLEALRAQAKARGLTGTDEELCASPVIREVYQGLIRDACSGLADHESVKRFVIVPATLSMDGGDLTPTMKVKRAVVARRFKTEIDRMFAAP